MIDRHCKSILARILLLILASLFVLRILTVKFHDDTLKTDRVSYSTYQTSIDDEYARIFNPLGLEIEGFPRVDSGLPPLIIDEDGVFLNVFCPPNSMQISVSGSL